MSKYHLSTTSWGRRCKVWRREDCTVSCFLSVSLSQLTFWLSTCFVECSTSLIVLLATSLLITSGFRLGVGGLSDTGEEDFGLWSFGSSLKALGLTSVLSILGTVAGDSTLAVILNVLNVLGTLSDRDLLCCSSRALLGSCGVWGLTCLVWKLGSLLIWFTLQGALLGCLSDSDLFRQ